MTYSPTISIKRRFTLDIQIIHFFYSPYVYYFMVCMFAHGHSDCVFGRGRWCVSACWAGRPGNLAALSGPFAVWGVSLFFFFFFQFVSPIVYECVVGRQYRVGTCNPAPGRCQVFNGCLYRKKWQKEQSRAGRCLIMVVVMTSGDHLCS